MPIPEGDPRIRLLKTAYVVYYHADLNRAKRFLLDFGLTVAQESADGQEVFYRGYGNEPYCYVARASTTGHSYFGGGAYVVESRDELERATRIPGATPITGLANAPGGGEAVTLTDPASHKVHLVYGQTASPVEHPHMQKLVVNYEIEKPRLGKFQRFTPGRPVPVHRWGHYGVTYPDGLYDTMFEWYTRHLALAVSDVVNVAGKPVTVFFHIDRGLEYTDHHAFFFKRAKPDAPAPAVAHAAFEVHDFDVQQLGHDYLHDQGYELCWGVGRHVLGSQVFDYWFDTSGFIVEHYADGDQVNVETPVAQNEAGPRTLAIWGPPVPEVF